MQDEPQMETHSATLPLMQNEPEKGAHFAEAFLFIVSYQSPPKRSRKSFWK